MWTVASTLNRTKNYCVRLLSLIAENNATQNGSEYQTNPKSQGNKNELTELISTVKITRELIDMSHIFELRETRLEAKDLFSLRKMICEMTNR